MIKAFPKIFAVGTDYIQDLFKEEVEVTEKIDGSQFVFGKLDGQLYLRSKGVQIFVETPQEMFKEAIDYVISIQDKLPDNTVFYTEYLKHRGHNILKYDRIPKNHLILFGVSTTQYSFIPDFQKYAELLDIETVPVLFKGKVDSFEQFKELLDHDSVLGGTKVEGIVIKNYARPFLLGGQPIPLMMGKFVREEFKETHRDRWGREFTGKGRWQTFLESFKTEARWQKAIQHLEEKGELEHSPRDIGKLLKEVNIDVEAEEKENIKTFLWNENKRDVLRTASAGLPEWYKEQLAKKSFNEPNQEQGNS